MHISELRESKYLKKEECDPPITGTISHLTEENMAMENEKPEMKWVLHFREDIKPLSLNTTNGQLIALALGSEETDDWEGQKITLYNDPSIMFKGKVVGGIRVKVPSKKGPAKAISSPAMDLNEEPF